MVLTLTFEAEGPVVLPGSYNHILQGFFYASMDRLFSEFLHDSGFVHGGRRFKLFTFSKLGYRSLDKREGLLWIEPPLTVHFSSPLLRLTESISGCVVRKESFKLGSNVVFLSSIGAREYDFREEMKVRCLSPITVYRTPPGRKRFEYLTPYQEDFYGLLKSNLKKKYELVYGRRYTQELDIKPVVVRPQHRKKIIFKGTLIEAWEGVFRIRATEEMMRVVMYAGLGVKNSAGFGMVEPC